MDENKWKMLLASRKFWAAAVGVVVVVIRAADPNFPLNEEQLTSITALLAAYILGTALESKPAG